jgi:hypothetical protein
MTNADLLIGRVWNVAGETNQRSSPYHGLTPPDHEPPPGASASTDELPAAGRRLV